MRYNPAQTVDEPQLAAYAQTLAAAYPSGVVHLIGDLGTGKTTFCRYWIQTIIADAKVTSPTYSIVHEYSHSGGTIYHIDLYRLRHPQEVEELGLRDLPAQSLVLIEWPECGQGLAPPADLTVTLAHAGESRRLTIQPPLGATTGCNT